MDSEKLDKKWNLEDIQFLALTIVAEGLKLCNALYYL